MTTTTRPRSGRRVLQPVLRAAAVALFVTILGGLVGWVARDRVPVVALLMYAPLLPLGVAALVWDIAAHGRGLVRGRFALGVSGLVAIAVGLSTTLGRGLPPAPDTSGGAALTVLQWNVRWGGGRGGQDGIPENWQSIGRDIAGHAPDIVILSESPGDDRLTQLQGMLGPTWTSVTAHHQQRARYLYRLMVLARWRVTVERDEAIPTGRVMQAVVAAPGGDVRVLVVDGESAPWHDRTPRLRAVAQLLRDAAVSGKPIDIVAGDFNAVGRSVGFDDIAREGFVSSGAAAPGWRPTWPAVCPLFDIDHLWVNRRFALTSVERFTNYDTDHRGTVARLARAVEAGR